MSFRISLKQLNNCLCVDHDIKPDRLYNFSAHAVQFGLKEKNTTVH